MNSEGPAAKLVSSIGTVAILSWFVFLGPLGALILFGVAASMLSESNELCSLLIGLTSLPVSMTVLWGLTAGTLWADKIWSEPSVLNQQRDKLRI